MGGGSSGDPQIGPTEDSDPSSSGDNDTQQTDFDDHPSEEDSEESGTTQTPSSGGLTGGGRGGAAGSSASAPPATEESPAEESEHGGSEEEESKAPGERAPPEEKPDMDDNDEAEQKAQVVVHSDPWDNVGFSLYPIRYQLKEEYGGQVEIYDRLIPVRTFESPEKMAERWEQDARRHEMPVDTFVWSSDSPESTELSNRAFVAAREQSVALAEDYIRRLRVASIAEGRNIEDRETLIELADEIGLDSDQLDEDWDAVDVRTSTRTVDLPKTTVHIDGETFTQSGYLHVDDLKMPFEQAGLDEGDPQPLYGFVDEYESVAVKEVQQVYGLSREEALNELQNTDGVEPVEFGDMTFWTTSK
jgi:hypothetical protein